MVGDMRVKYPDSLTGVCCLLVQGKFKVSLGGEQWRQGLVTDSEWDHPILVGENFVGCYSWETSADADREAETF